MVFKFILAKLKTWKKAPSAPNVLLPPEVILAVLDQAPQPGVLAIAGVCRAWRSVAVSHSKYYLHFRIFRRMWYPDKLHLHQAPPIDRTLAALHDATRKGTPVVLEFDLLRKVDALRLQTNLDTMRTNFDGLRTDFDRFTEDNVLRYTSAALDRVVVRLVMIFCPSDELGMRILQLPAPRLESFSWIGTALQIGRLPSSLFGGHAPLLRDLALEHVYISANSALVLPSVDTVRILTHPTIKRPLASLFPNLRTLEVGFVFRAVDGVHPQLSIQALDGTHLKKLSISCVHPTRSWAIVTTPIPYVPSLEISRYLSANIESCIKRLESPHLAIDGIPSGQEKVCMAFLGSREQTINLALQCWDAWPHTLSLICSLHLKQHAVKAFLEAMHIHAPITLPVLVQMTVEMTARDEPLWPRVTASKMFKCPTLRSLTVAWYGSDGSRMVPPSMTAHDLAEILDTFSTSQPVSYRLHRIDYLDGPPHSIL